MILISLLFACAFVLSGTAIYYSVLGLMAIFSTAPVPIAIMGTSLEVTKLVVASWLYRNWKEVPLLLKTYFTLAVMILMFITSIGIYGFLSKAHLDQGIPTGDVVSKVALYDEKIKTEEITIANARKTLAQLDSQVDQFMSRTTTEKGVASSVTVRARQKKERQTLVAEIQQSQKVLAKLREDRIPVAAELRKVEAEVGPIKYIAQLFSDKQDESTLEAAVRGMTLLIVAVFDPLAVLLLIAANWSLLRREKPMLEKFIKTKAKDKKSKEVQLDIQEEVKLDVQEEAQLEQIKEELIVDDPDKRSVKWHS